MERLLEHHIERYLDIFDGKDIYGKGYVGIEDIRYITHNDAGNLLDDAKWKKVLDEMGNSEIEQVDVVDYLHMVTSSLVDSYESNINDEFLMRAFKEHDVSNSDKISTENFINIALYFEKDISDIEVEEIVDSLKRKEDKSICVSELIDLMR